MLRTILTRSPIRNLDELKIQIANEIENILRKTLSDAFSNLVKMMHLCISVEREHFEQLCCDWIYIAIKFP